MQDHGVHEAFLTSRVIGGQIRIIRNVTGFRGGGGGGKHFVNHAAAQPTPHVGNMRAPMQSMHAGVIAGRRRRVPPQRWCTRAAPFRRTRDPLVNCTQVARTHARSLLRDIRPASLFVERFHRGSPCISPVPLYTLLSSSSLLSFLLPSIQRGRDSDWDSVENFTAPLEPASILNGSSRSTIRRDWWWWWWWCGCRDTIGFFPPNPFFTRDLAAFERVANLGNFPTDRLPYRDKE